MQDGQGRWGVGDKIEKKKNKKTVQIIFKWNTKFW